ncbi:ABC transporter ATP-binding protein [Inconstantimicrobium mannanitabidum]|uniref:ABC transporter ATP-binding protein n=2 Tax=Inconstantimicrobium mannanitabidum TaxID=1604901 RepID=A0ACB5RER2_9CLOT|nr:ABC transporter ATP-binding protein [Clostridium sp. TW13]GKX67743.1 ABC transporter ATP-binding protein [Clostridium sp. TW13]GKX67747.1 ABC transporter ATP-binding protein [Clostridium sp. TW13]
MEILRLENIHKVYGKGNLQMEALKGVNLVVNEGELIAIIGVSGSGKSTLLNIIGTLDKASTGKYILEGKETEKYSEKEMAKLRNKTFGFVVQHFALIKGFSVYDNVEIPLAYSKGNKKKYEERVKTMLTKLGIRDKIDSKPNQLSGGQCQRVAIARALVNDAKILLADEPTGALDKQTGQEVLDIFKKLNEEGKTVIIVTHDEKIANQCNRVIRMEDGKIVEDKSLIEVVQ